MGIISKTFTMLSNVMDYPVIYTTSFFLLLSWLHIPIKSFISSFLRKLPLCIAADSWRKCVSLLCRALFAWRWQLALAQTFSPATQEILKCQAFSGHPSSLAIPPTHARATSTSAAAPLCLPFVIMSLSVVQFIQWLIIIWKVLLGVNRKGGIPAGGFSLIS